MQKKSNFAALALTGLAAYGYYKYSKMSAAEKENLVGDLKTKGKSWAEKNLPENLRSLLGIKSDGESATGTAESSNSGF
ncbi:MAG: hypothetical protein ABIT96_04650 [Ferruginibacter sp.]